MWTSLSTISSLFRPVHLQAPGTPDEFLRVIRTGHDILQLFSRRFPNLLCHRFRFLDYLEKRGDQKELENTFTPLLYSKGNNDNLPLERNKIKFLPFRENYIVIYPVSQRNNSRKFARNYGRKIPSTKLAWSQSPPSVTHAYSLVTQRFVTGGGLSPEGLRKEGFVGGGGDVTEQHVPSRALKNSLFLPCS